MVCTFSRHFTHYWVVWYASSHTYLLDTELFGIHPLTLIYLLLSCLVYILSHLITRYWVVWCKYIMFELFGKNKLSLIYAVLSCLILAHYHRLKRWLEYITMIYIIYISFLVSARKTFCKELSLCNKLWFSNTFIFSTWWWKPLIFQA